MAQLTELNKIAIAEIVFYTPALCIGILLAVRHGWGRSSGWLFLIFFSVIRLIGSALQLASLNDPTNINLLIGASTMQNIGLSAMILVMLGLLSRVLDSIGQNHITLATPRRIHLVQLLVGIGLILGIVGGSMSGNNITQAVDQGQSSYAIPTVSQAGLGLMIAGYVLLAIGVVLTAFQVGAVEPGEKRLLLADGIALPFVLVRLIYSALATFTSNPNFRLYPGSPDYANYLLGMAVIMEMICVVIFEGIGLTLQKRPANRKPSAFAKPGRLSRLRGVVQSVGQGSGVEQV